MSDTIAHGSPSPPRLRVLDGGESPSAGRKRGPPAGTPKPLGSGRAPGTRNRVTPAAKDRVRFVIDKNAGALFTRLFNVALGRKVRVGPVAGPGAKYAYPDLVTQVKAA